DDAGVLGVDDYEESLKNRSAIWTGSAWHRMASQPEEGLIVPEARYTTGYAISFTRDVGGYHIAINPQEGVCMGFVVRGWFHQDGADRHLPIKISNYGAVGAMTYTRYPVPPDAGQFFSQGYINDNAASALKFDHSGIG